MMLWLVETSSDNMKWKFETIDQAINFYNDVRKFGEVASFPRFIG